MQLEILLFSIVGNYTLVCNSCTESELYTLTCLVG